MLKYMLETEAKGSSPLLNIDWFNDPFNYKLLVGTGSVGETKAVTVDLVETFNWLLGLRVRHMDFFWNGETRRRGDKEMKKLKFVVVEGINPKGEKLLVIWRKIRDLTTENAESPEEVIRQREKANEELDEFFKKQQYNTLDSEYDIIYVNGDNNLMNIPLQESPGRPVTQSPGRGTPSLSEAPRYKVRLIEEEFKRLMFDVANV